jgi:dihydrofolate reductase
MFRLIAAVDRRLGIAKGGIMPWYIPEDEAYFTSETKTLGGNILVGGATYREALKEKPLEGRQNYLLSRHELEAPGFTIVADLDKFLEDFKDKDVWIIGGGEIFKLVMEAGKADMLYLTHIEADFNCDRFFPKYDNYKLIEHSEEHEQNGFRFRYARYSRPEQ